MSKFILLDGKLSVKEPPTVLSPQQLDSGEMDHHDAIMQFVITSTSIAAEVAANKAHSVMKQFILSQMALHVAEQFGDEFFDTSVPSNELEGTLIELCEKAILGLKGLTSLVDIEDLGTDPTKLAAMIESIGQKFTT